MTSKPSDACLYPDGVPMQHGYEDPPLCYCPRCVAGRSPRMPNDPTPDVERMWCRACGTVTRNRECDCTFGDRPDLQNLVNYADSLQEDIDSLVAQLRAADQRAAELAAQNATLRAALLRLLGPRDDERIGWRSTLATNSDVFCCEFCGAEHADANRIDHKAYCSVVLTRTAIATTPDAALKVVRELIVQAEKAEQLAASEFGEGVEVGDAIDAARRIFGPADALAKEPT
jgi:hypothetical protein